MIVLGVGSIRNGAHIENVINIEKGVVVETMRCPECGDSIGEDEIDCPFCDANIFGDQEELNQTLTEEEGEMSIRFFTNDLLSKYGFGDGDLLVCLLSDHGFTDMHNQVLAEAVVQYIVPTVNRKIELLQVENWNWTAHNPIRAKRVDGVEVDDTGDNENLALTPRFVDIEKEAILDIARRIRAAA